MVFLSKLFNIKCFIFCKEHSEWFKLVGILVSFVKGHLNTSLHKNKEMSATNSQYLVYICTYVHIRTGNIDIHIHIYICTYKMEGHSCICITSCCLKVKCTYINHSSICNNIQSLYSYNSRVNQFQEMVVIFKYTLQAWPISTSTLFKLSINHWSIL